MTLAEYLKQRNKNTNALTLREAGLIGLPWPLPRGWPKKFSAVEIDKNKLGLLNIIVQKKIALKNKKAIHKKKKQSSGHSSQNDRIRAELEQSLGRPLSCHVAPVAKEPKKKKEPNKKAAWVYDGFYETREWRELRYKALVKHGAACQCCGATRSDGVRLHVDHIKPRSKFPSLQLDISNLQVLCEDCNLGKSNKDDTDWR